MGNPVPGFFENDRNRIEGRPTVLAATGRSFELPLFCHSCMNRNSTHHYPLDSKAGQRRDQGGASWLRDLLIKASNRPLRSITQYFTLLCYAPGMYGG